MKSSVSIVIPCLNEEKTLPVVLEKIGDLRQKMLRERTTEVIVSDNGSVDRSVEIALKFGATVVHCKEKGYGAALQSGIREATGEIIVFADADNTYDFLESPKLIEKLESGYDLVFGSRLAGTIHPGAMPFLHQHLGTPVLNRIINCFYAKNGFRITDCNSGFRCFKRASFLSWNVKSTGMEFASEMLVKALNANAKIEQVPISLYPHASDRMPHLKTWRDGMRHLLQILLEAPHFFYWTGLLTFFSSWIIMLFSLLFRHSWELGFISILGIHTTIVALLGSLSGLTWWGIGLLLSAKRKDNKGIYRFLIDLSEDRLFWFSFFYISVSVLLLIALFIRWGINGFTYLSLEKETVVLSAFISNGLLFISNVFTAHLIKRT